MLEFVCLPWSEVCSARVTSLLLLLLLLGKQTRTTQARFDQGQTRTTQAKFNQGRERENIYNSIYYTLCTGTSIGRAIPACVVVACCVVIADEVMSHAWGVAWMRCSWVQAAAPQPGSGDTKAYHTSVGGGQAVHMSQCGSCSAQPQPANSASMHRV